MKTTEEKLKEAIKLLDQVSTYVYNIDSPTTGSGYRELIEYVDWEVYNFLEESRNDN